MYQIGRVNYKSIRDFILDNEIEVEQTIILNYLDFDDLVLEFRQIYGEAFTVPFEIITVKIIEDRSKRIQRGFVKVKD